MSGIVLQVYGTLPAIDAVSIRSNAD